ncbi:MAG: GtrA family protein [Saprospiraceae bacterium]
MSNSRERIKDFFILFGKFAVTGAMASVVNFTTFNVLFYWGFDLDEMDRTTAAFKRMSVVADMIAYASGVLFNYVLHKRYIFEQRRAASVTFALYILVSIGGIALSAALTWLFVKMPFFANNPQIMKISTMLLVFVYNFFSKRFAFERRIFSLDTKPKVNTEAPNTLNN